MADITNKMNPSASINVGSGQIISPESSESVLLSPGVREAMDLIFPKSTTQLLQRGHSFEEDKFLGVRASKENLHPGSTSAPASHVNTVTIPCSVSSAFLSTTTTNTVMTASSEVVTSTWGNGSSVISQSPFVSTFIAPAALTMSKTQEDKVQEVESRHIPVELTKKTQDNVRISNADVEIISSSDESDERTSRRVNSVDLSSSEFHSKDNSDSEDMCRPFVGIAKEKEKRKKGKTKPSSLLCEINVKSGSRLTEAEKTSINSDTPTFSPDVSSAVTIKDISSSIEQPKKNARQESLSLDNVNKVTTSDFSKDGRVQDWILQNGLFTNNSHINSWVVSEDASNISFSSTKENMQNGKSKSKQRLPEIKRLYFNIVKHKNKIRNTFPPCFVVMRKMKRSYKQMKDVYVTGSVLPLSVRLKHLLDLCDKGSVNCKHRKEEFVYRNIFEETTLSGDGDDDFENSRGKRSLRKRHKHISYVEPSEDDIVDDFSRKRSRTKHKDINTRSEDESGGESKKRKKQNLSDSKTVSSDIVTPVTNTHVQIAPKEIIVYPPADSSDKSNLACKESTPLIEMNKGKKIKEVKVSNKNTVQISPNEIIVYPPTSLGVKNSYCIKVGGKDKAAYKTYSKQKDKNNAPVQAPSANVSVTRSNTLPGTLVRHPNTVMVFPSLPLGFSSGLPVKPMLPGAPISTPISTSGETQKPPQFCVVKMDGKDVLLQLVPSGGVGVPVPVVMPKGKTLLVPPASLVQGPSHIYGQPLRSTLSVSNPTQTMPTIHTSIVTASQGNIVSSSPLPSLFGIPVMSTSSQNVSLTALPVLSAAQLTSLTSTASIRPISLSTSRTYHSHNSVTVLSSPVNEASPVNSVVSSVITSSTLSNHALPAVVTSMAAPNTTTVVRSIRVPASNLRAIAPNQATSLRSVRIFVPGCSSMGSSGHFATIGSIANSSPLTHLTASSALLPQRKHGIDQDLSPEQRAAKRRKLEAKYPLPPGVVIKTESLDDVSNQSSVVTAVSGPRSLLTQNLHLLSSSRPGSGFQSIRILSPALANALSVRHLRGNSNIIYRAASIGGRQTVLVPTSFGQISTKTTTAVTSTSLTTSSSFASSSSVSSGPTTVTAGVATATTTSVTNTTSDTSFISTVLSSSSETSLEGNSSPRTHSPAAGLILPENTSASMPVTPSNDTMELLTTDASLTHKSVIVSCESSVVTDCAATSLTTPHDNSCEPSTAIIENSTDNVEQSQEKASSEDVTLENVRAGLEELRKFIQVQELRGLKGERLEKLKELLRKKEEHYMYMQNLTSVSASISAVEVNGDIDGTVTGEDTSMGTVSVDGQGGSEADPFVID